MPSRTNPTSRASRGSSPPLVFEVRPCRRARLLWALFGLLTAVALCFSFLRAAEWRAVLLPMTATGAALVLAWLPGLAVLGGMGPFAVRRIEWAADGRWSLVRSDGRCETAQLSGATVALGPWILLAWRVGDARRRLLSQRYALIGVGAVSPAAFRALTGRLSLLRGRDAVGSGVVAP